MTRLVLWRHGQTQANVSAIIQGTIDSELSEVGRAQAETAAPVLAALKPELIVSSDLRRAADTAAALSALTGVRVSYDVRLRERAYGEWQGLNATQITERWPEEYARWRAGKPVGGAGVEESEEVAKRAVAALQEVAAAAAGRTAVVVTHASAAGNATAALLGWPATVARTLVNLANCHWTELRLDAVRGWQLVAHNVGYAP